MRPSRAENPTICLICDADGIVRMLAPGAPAGPAAATPPAPAAAEDDGWSSPGSAAPSVAATATAPAAIGVPLIKTYWFDHLDCDHREVRQVLRRSAAKGMPDRLRVWLRFDEHQLIRAELTVTPLSGAGGDDERLVLVRAEPTPAAPPGRRTPAVAAGAETTRPVRLAAEPAAALATPAAAPPAIAADLLDAPLPTPLLRLDAAHGTVLAANAAFADLLGRGREACANQPLTELCDPADRRAISEFVAATRPAGAEAAAADRSIEVRLLADASVGRDVHVRLSVTADPARADASSVLVVARDVSSERQMVQLMARADQLAAVAVRNSGMLRTLERAFDRAPIGFALTSSDETIRANGAFEAATARAPDAAIAASELAARVRKDREPTALDLPAGHVRSFWAGDEQHDVIGTLIWPRDVDAQRRLRALRVLTADEGRVAIAAVTPAAAQAAEVPLAPVAADDDLSAAPPTTLAASLADASLKVARDAIAESRSLNTRVTRAVVLRDGRDAELAVVPIEGDGAIAELRLARPTAAQLDAMRGELARLREQSAAHAEAMRAARAEIDAAARAADDRVARVAADRAAHLDATLQALGAGSFTWDVTDGHVVADARARGLLNIPDNTADSLTQATLLAALRADERQRYERALFDAMSPEGGNTLDVEAHVGTEGRPVRLIGRVLFEADADATASAEADDPTRLLAVVLDLSDERTRNAHLDAARTAHAALESAHATLQAAHATALRDLADRDATIAERDARLAEMARARDELQARITTLEASLKTAEASARTFEGNVKALEANVRTLTRDRASLEADVARRGREAEAMNGDLAAIRAQVAEIDRRRAEVEADRDAAARRIAETEAERARLVEQLADVERRREQAESTARLRTAELNALFECVPDAVRIRSDGVTRHNAAAAQLFGEAVSFGLDGAPADRNGAIQTIGFDGDALPAAVALGGESDAATLRLSHGDRRLVVHSSAAPVRVDGRTVGAVIVDQDRTEAERVEALLARSERSAAAIFQNTGVGVAYLDARGVVLDANAQTSVLLGFSHGDLVGRPLATVAATAADRATLDGQVQAVLSGELASVSAEFQLARRDDRPYWVQVTVALGTATAGTDEGEEEPAPSLVVLIQDVDELRRLRDESAAAEARRAAAESRRRLIAAAAEDGLVLLGANGKYVEANAAAKRLLGSADASSSDAARFVVSETGETITATAFWARVGRGGRSSSADYRVERNGVPPRHVRVSVSSAASIDGLSEEDARLTIVRVVDLSSLAAAQEELRAAQGRIVEAHTQIQQQSAQWEERFASAVLQLGAAAATATLPARTLADDPRLTSEARDASRRVADAIRVHERLVAHFNAAATMSAGAAEPALPASREPVDVHALVEEAVTLIDDRFHAGGRLRRHLDASRAICDVDPALARHGLWSLFAHAASQTSRARGVVAIVRSALSSDAKRLEITLTWPSNRSNTAEIVIARSLIEAANGTLVVSPPGETQTRATISFPLAPLTPATAAEPARPPVAALLIEDHESTARVLSRQLTRLGCEVRHVRDLTEARTTLGSKSPAGGRVELIVCDLTMPEGDAVAFLADAARRRVPAIALRGYEGGPSTDTLRQAGVVEQLVKPVDLNALAAAIKRLTAKA